MKALMNSALGTKEANIVKIKQHNELLSSDNPCLHKQGASDMNLIKSSAKIVVNPTLLKNKDLLELLQLTCDELVEISGSLKLAESMPTLMVDDSMAIELINGFLFSQINDKNENMGELALTRIVSKNFQKFDRIYIFVLEYTMMGKAVIESPVMKCGSILINILLTLPSCCTLQMVYHPLTLGQKLIAIFDRQSLMMNKLRFYPLDASMGLLINLPSLNYIHGCVIQSNYKNLFAFIKSNDPEMQSKNYQEARDYMQNKQCF